MCICLYICVFVGLYVFIKYVCMSVCLYVCMFVFLYVCMLVCFYVCKCYHPREKGKVKYSMVCYNGSELFASFTLLEYEQDVVGEQVQVIEDGVHVPALEDNKQCMGLN